MMKHLMVVLLAVVGNVILVFGGNATVDEPLVSNDNDKIHKKIADSADKQTLVTNAASQEFPKHAVTEAPVIIDNVTEVIPDATTIIDDNNTTTSVNPNTTTTTVTPTTKTTPATSTTVTTKLPPTPAPVPPTNSTTESTTSTTTTTPATPPKSSTQSPSTSTTSAPSTTTAPHNKGRHFDGPSFIGGIILATGLMGISFVAFKFYKARTERNYHTL